MQKKQRENEKEKAEFETQKQAERAVKSAEV